MLRLAGYLSSILGAAGLLLVIYEIETVRVFLIENVAQDGDAQDTARLYISMFTLPAFLICFGLILLHLVKRGFFSPRHVTSFRQRVTQPHLGVTALFFTVGLLFVAQFIVGCKTHTPISGTICTPFATEGFYEILTFVGFLIGAGWLLWLARSCFARDHNTPQGSRFNGALLVLAAFACFFVAMEEVSWGQTFFRWATPEVWAEINTQEQTNIHNLFTPLFFVANTVGAILVFVGSYVAWIMVDKGLLRGPLTVLVPNPNLIGLAAWFPLAAPSSGELLEFLIAVYLLVYCWGLSLTLRDPFPEGRAKAAVAQPLTSEEVAHPN